VEPGDVYRFLLRMPEELRERLVGSAGDAGRSLNREIVQRLEQSFEEAPVVARQARGHSLPRGYRRPALALGLVASVVVVLALLAGASNVHFAAKKSPKLSGDPDRMTLRANQKNLTLPGSLSREGLRKTQTEAEQELVDRAYPARTLPFAYRKGALDYFSHSIRGRGNDDSKHGWQLAGPSTATYPAVLNRSNADYVASGRVSAMAISPSCSRNNCRVWVAAAGGGVWRTDDGLSSSPRWDFVSGSFATNAIGSLAYDATSNTLYAGTGEPNASGDSEAGLGLYKSTDSGSNWSLVPGSPSISNGNSIASVVATGNTIYLATTLGLRGASGVAGGAVFDPNAPKVGLYKSTNGGQSFSLIWDDSTFAAGPTGWGVNHVELDTHGVIYLAAEGEGIWRSANGGTSWEQAFATQDPASRTEFALNTVNPGGHTRIYVGDGGNETGAITPDGASYESTSGVYRADNIDTKTSAQLTDGTANPGYTAFSTWDRTNPGYLTYDYCWQQCTYDNAVVSPAGSPDIVYVLGAYNYDFPARNNGRTVLLSTDAGTHWYDQTMDVPQGRDATQNGIHPDQHALVVNPSNPLQFFEGSDGGVVRSSGQLADGTQACVDRGLSPASASGKACRNSLALVPTHIDSLNAGLSTLQFQTVSVDPAKSKGLQGGTQDNGTWEGKAGDQSWTQSMYGDGGVSAYDIGNKSFRMNEFYDKYTDVNFQSGDPTAWVIASAPFFAAGEDSAFYKPQINDPAVSGTMFVGLNHVWRTQDFGGDQAYLEANCPEFTTPGDQAGCGDFVPLGDPSGLGGVGTTGDLTAAGVYGADKSGGYVVAVTRAASDHNTLWAATRRGRVFISKNTDAANAGAVTFTRLDSLSAATPRRFVSGIVVDPNNPNHAYVSFGGYNAATPGQPGHVFDVMYNPLNGSATWTSLDRGVGPLGDLPVTTLALDKKSNRLYAGTDFGVLTQVGNDGFWSQAAPGMPMVEVSGLTVDPKNRTLYAATHGRAVWSLQLRDNAGRGDNH
jgi:hypothetical protein